MLQERYVYHIKDRYFENVQDDKLMCNKEGGKYRPTFFCMEDPKTPGLLWVVPMSSQIGKYTALRDKKIAKYGKCDTIVIGNYDGGQTAFLLQNMFPITENYLDHIHTRNGNPVPVSYPLAQEIKKKMQHLRKLTYQGKNVVFTDILRLEELMAAELRNGINPATQRNSLDKMISEAEDHRNNLSSKQNMTFKKECKRQI